MRHRFLASLIVAVTVLASFDRAAAAATMRDACDVLELSDIAPAAGSGFGRDVASSTPEICTYARTASGPYRSVALQILPKDDAGWKSARSGGEAVSRLGAEAYYLPLMRTLYVRVRDRVYAICSTVDDARDRAIEMTAARRAVARLSGALPVVKTTANQPHVRNACDALTPGNARKAIGAGAKVASQLTSNSECSYSAGSASISLVLMPEGGDGIGLREARAGERVPGIGDEAYLYGGTLTIRKGTGLIMVTVRSDSGDYEALEKATARSVLARL